MTSTSPTTRSLVIAACMIAAALYLGTASRAEVIPPRDSLTKMTFFLDGWRGRREADFTPEVLAILGVDDYIIRSYSKPGSPPVGLYIGYHDSQRTGDTIHSPLNCLPGAGWLPVEQGRSTIPVRTSAGASPTSIEVNRVIIQKGLDRQLVLYWYQSHRRVVASEYLGKVYTVLDAVRYNRTDAALIRVVVPILEGSTPQEPDATAAAFVQSLFPTLAPYFPA